MAAAGLARRSDAGAGRPPRSDVPVEFQRRIAREALGLEVDEIDGGHMVAMSTPGELADPLETYRPEARRARRGATR